MGVGWEDIAGEEDVGGGSGGRREEEEEEEEVPAVKRERAEEGERNVVEEVLTPSNWTGFVDSEDVKGLFSLPPLSPLSPHPTLGLLMVI